LSLKVQLMLEHFSKVIKMIPPPKDRIRSATRALPPITDPPFGQHFDWLGKYNVVLLGDASHGTSEFYQARAEITKHLIKTHGFNVIALEADWPHAEAIDRFVRQRPRPASKASP
jgi:erythromycin esterase-like protein